MSTQHINIYFFRTSCGERHHQVEWEEGFEQYVIHRLPQLESLDGRDITKSMRIVAAQHFPRLEVWQKLQPPFSNSWPSVSVGTIFLRGPEGD